MLNGTVKWFDGGGPDAFAHFSAITMEGFKSLKEGARVSFELTDGPKGPMAINIQSEQAAGQEIKPEAS